MDVWMCPSIYWSNAMTTNINGYTVRILNSGEFLVCDITRGEIGQLQF
jgi:hypothetical protein